MRATYRRSNFPAESSAPEEVTILGFVNGVERLCSVTLAVIAIPSGFIKEVRLSELTYLPDEARS